MAHRSRTGQRWSRPMYRLYWIQSCPRCMQRLCISHHKSVCVKANLIQKGRATFDLESNARFQKPVSCDCHDWKRHDSISRQRREMSSMLPSVEKEKAVYRLGIFEAGSTLSTTPMYVRTTILVRTFKMARASCVNLNFF